MTYYYFSLGCKVNSYECNALSSLLKQKGYKEDKNNPDVIIINTCSVTATADQKSRQHIRKFKNNYPSAIIVVMGCYAQGHAKFIFDDIKPDILVGTSNRNRIPELIDRYVLDKKPIFEVEDNPRLFKYEEFAITSCSENIRSYLKIQDGCDNFCSYCLIPYVRGRSRSRSFDSIINEAKELVKIGYQEIVLSGIHVGGYGKDLDNMSFSKLVKELLDIDGLYRLRISSIEESEIDDELIRLINTKDNLAKHLHIPLQSGAKATLKAMNRKYTKEEFLNKIKHIKNACPDIALTTDVIVGFPGESDEDFLETYDFIKECEFNMLHVFPFSAREKTLAFKLPNQISPDIKKQRVSKLLKLSDKLWNSYCDKFISKEVSVLVEQYDEINNVNIGHTSNYLEVKIPSETSCVGKIIKTTYKASNNEKK